MSYFRTFVGDAGALLDYTLMDSYDTSDINPSRHTGGPRRRNPQQRLQRFCFTLPNYTDTELSWLKDPTAWPRIPRWLVIGKETCPSTGTLHLQGICLVFFIRGFHLYRFWNNASTSAGPRPSGAPSGTALLFYMSLLH